MHIVLMLFAHECTMILTILSIVNVLCAHVHMCVFSTYVLVYVIVFIQCAYVCMYVRVNDCEFVAVEGLVGLDIANSSLPQCTV